MASSSELGRAQPVMMSTLVRGTYERLGEAPLSPGLPLVHCPSTRAVPVSYLRRRLPDRVLEVERALRVSALVQELPGGYVGVIFTLRESRTCRVRTFPVQRPLGVAHPDQF